MRILILCTGNSCRSQMAQALLQSFNKQLMVRSAGTVPAPQVHPIAVKVMQELNMDISTCQPKDVRTYLHESWDYLITVCDDARESCPVFHGQVKHRLHIGFSDPARASGTESEVLNEFRSVRDKIKTRFYAFYRSELKKQ